MVSAGRQLVDDFGLARARAISERTTVHVVFVPPDIMNWPQATGAGQEIARDQKLQLRLKSSQYTTYALYAERTVGDQPGRPQARYLTSWRSLPDGIFIATNKFIYNQAALGGSDDYTRPFEYTANTPNGGMGLRAPTIYGINRSVPHVAFDPQGRLVDNNNHVRFQNEVLWLGRGSFLYSRDPTTGDITDFDLRETPPGNSNDPTNYHRVVVDGLTGRARVETPRIQ
jgi:Tfp pilus assembly protein FimT